MANHKSAVKAHAQSLRRRDHNRQLRSRMRHALREARSAIEAAAPGAGGDAAKARDAIRATVALIDKLAGKGVIHQNAAARHKSRLTKRLDKVGGAPAAA